MSTHTPRNWQRDKDTGNIFYIQHGESYSVGFSIELYWSRRIVACVNACEGIPTEALEGGVIGELLETMEKF